MFLGLAATSAPAMADLQYTLNQGGSVGPTPFKYGTVTLKQLGAGTVGSPFHVQVTVSLQPGEVFLTTGSHSGFTWNLVGLGNPSSITITSANAGLFNPPSLTAGSHGNSPFGSFEYAIENTNTGGDGGILGPLVFDIKRTGGLLLTDFSANSDGNFFGADIGTGCTFASGKWGFAATGVVASNSPPVRVPEPGTWMLSMAGLAGLVGLTMQRRRKMARA